MAKMNPALKWTLIIGGLGVTGVIGYFVYKKIKEKQEQKAQNEKAKNNPPVSESQVKSHSHNKKATPSGDESEKAPFKNTTEGNAFRKWVNENYPDYAKTLFGDGLGLTGSYDNKYVQDAWKNYGSIYQEEKNNVTSVKYSKEFADLLSAWKKPLLINKAGNPYFKVGVKPFGIACVVAFYIFDKKDGKKVGSPHFFKLYDTLNKKTIAYGEWFGDLTSFKVQKAPAKAFEGTTISGGKNVGDKISQMMFGSTGKIEWC